jgi:4-azaleucine resistance transporter AzlC
LTVGAGSPRPWSYFYPCIRINTILEIVSTIFFKYAMATNHNQVIKASPQSELLAGCRGITPLIIGAIPFGIIFGALAKTSALSFADTIAMSAFIFSGSSQFIALGLLATGTALPLIILTTLIVNLRHLLYAVSLVPFVKHLPQTWKLILGFLLTDEAFVVAVARYNQTDNSPYKHWYHFGAALFMYINWLLCTLVGRTLGHLIPDVGNWGLDFAMSVTIIGMLVPYLKNKPMFVAGAIAGVISLFCHSLPHNLGLIVAAIAGIAAGIYGEKI